MKNCLFLLILFLCANVNAQFAGSVGYSWFFDDNPQRTSLVEPEFVNSVKADFSYKFLDKELYLNYSGNYNNYKTLSDRTFQIHSLGLNYAFNTLNEEEENVFTGISYSLKKGTGNYLTYDYWQYAGFINGKFTLAEASFLQTAFNTSYKKYPSLNNLVHFENFVSSQLSGFFSTGTGVFCEAGIGAMNYSYNDITSNIPTVDMHTGKMNPKNKKTFIVYQFRSMFKVSQSLFENTGINIHYLLRENLKENKGMFSSADYIYSGDDELWDDPYGYSGYELGTELTQNLPDDITLKLSAEYSRRRYTNNLSDSLNLTQRIDGRFGLWGGISKAFNELPFINSLELNIEYMFINNNSNSGIFNYKNNMLLVGMEIGI